MSGTDPTVLTDAEMFNFCAEVLEMHVDRIFVYQKDGRRLIADLRRRGAGALPPVRESIDQGGVEVERDGETIARVHELRHRNETIDEWLPDPAPGRTNIRLSVVDDAGMVAEMEFGNATEQLAKATVSRLTGEHAKDVKARGKAVS